MHSSPRVVRRVLVFTDIEGSTALAERLGDEAWVHVIRAHNALVRAETSLAGGSVIERSGDGFMLSFDDETSALECAVAIQRALDVWAIADGSPLRVRIGVHSGRILEADGDLYGLEIAVAARVTALARGGEILVSGPVRIAVAGGEVALDDGTSVRLKGISREHTVFAVHWARRVESLAFADDLAPVGVERASLAA